MAASIARGMTFEESVLLGNAAGALAVTRGGAYDALPTAEAVRVLASAGDRETHGGPADGT